MLKLVNYAKNFKHCCGMWKQNYILTRFYFRLLLRALKVSNSAAFVYCEFGTKYLVS